MKKQITLIFLMWVMVLHGAEPYNLGEKEIIGENKEKIADSINDKPVIEEISVFNKIEFDPAKGDPAELADDEVEEVSVEQVKGAEKPIYNISIYTNKKEVLTTGAVTGEPVRKGTGNMEIGAGGYDVSKIIIDKYKMNYSSEKDKLKYTIGIEGINDKGFRKNSGETVNSIFGALGYERWDLTLTGMNGDRFLPGIENGLAPVSSWSRFGIYAGELGYNIPENGIDKYRIGIKANITGTASSAGTALRDYFDNYFTLYGNYSDDVKFFNGDNKVKITASFIHENGTGFNSNIGRGVIEDRYTMPADKSIAITGKGVVDADITNEKGALNLSVTAGIEKKLAENLWAAGELSKVKSRKPLNEIIGAFERDDDFQINGIPNPEDGLAVRAGIAYTTKEAQGSINVTHNTVTDKIYYEENDTFAETPNEIPIKIKNYNGTLSWQEIEIKGKMKYDIWNGEIIYNMSNIAGVPFQAGNTVEINLGAAKDNHSVEMKNRFVSEAYGKLNNVNKLKGYYSADIAYNYKASEELEIGAYINNVFNGESYIKTGYKSESRKAGIKIKLNY